MVISHLWSHGAYETPMLHYCLMHGCQCAVHSVLTLLTPLLLPLLVTLTCSVQRQGQRLLLGITVTQPHM